jgi:hypothetical protein
MHQTFLNEPETSCCLLFLAERCDDAQCIDGQGFNKNDVCRKFVLAIYEDLKTAATVWFDYAEGQQFKISPKPIDLLKMLPVMQPGKISPALAKETGYGQKTVERDQLPSSDIEHISTLLIGKAFYQGIATVEKRFARLDCIICIRR